MSVDSRFPHMGNDGFPGVNNIDVYAYENVFDYTRWKPDVQIKICDVAWDSDYRDVPYWETDSTRDAWFDALTGISQTLVVETHILPDGTVKLPLPFGVMSRYNYIEVIYPEFTSEGQPIAYEDAGNRRARWFWFITDVRSIAPNTTECALQLDYWTTFINSCSIPYMMLERGHWPMTQVSVADYLAHPKDNTRYLLAPDVNYSNRCEKIAHTNYIVFNDTDVYAVVFCTGHVQESAQWGTYSDALVPADADAHADALRVNGARHYSNQGVPSVETFAMIATELNQFLYDVDTNVPQFKQTVQGVCFLSNRLVSIGDSFTWMGYTLYTVTAHQNLYQFDLDKSDFGIPDRYADIAKLYTSPYSRIEIANEDGVIATCNVEDLMNAKIEVRFALSLAFPSIEIDCEVNGFNGPETTYTFWNMTGRAFRVGGSWYKIQTSWDVPMFAVTQDPWETVNVASYYDRVQADINRQTALDNANASAATAQTNAKGLNARTQSNTNNTAETTLDNNERDRTLNTKIYGGSSSDRGLVPQFTYDTNERNNDYLDTQNASNGKVDFKEASTDDFTKTAKGLNNLKLNADIVVDNVFAGFATITDTAAIGTLASVSGVQSVASGAFSGVTGGAMSGGVAGAIGGGLLGAATGLISATGAQVSSNVVISKESSLTNQSMDRNRSRGMYAYHYNTAMNTATKDYNDDMRKYKNQLAYDTVTEQNRTAKNNSEALYGPLADTRADSGVVKWNAARTREVADQNATNTYDTATGNATRTSDAARQAIKHGRYQGGLKAPQVYGTMDPKTATVKPAGIWANIVTQPIGALSCAGDQMLRYGYALDQQVNVSTSGLSLMSNFTYWKASDIWLVGTSGVPEKAQERLIKAFKDGLTVWEHPSAIGQASIYDNAKKAS